MINLIRENIDWIDPLVVAKKLISAFGESGLIWLDSDGSKNGRWVVLAADPIEQVCSRGLPNDKTSKIYWRYLSSNNLLESLNNIDTEDEKQISLLEKATHQGNYEEIDLLNLYKRFQFSVDQLLNIDDEIQKISKIQSRSLLYQCILLKKYPNISVKLSRSLKESF